MSTAKKNRKELEIDKKKLYFLRSVERQRAKGKRRKSEFFAFSKVFHLLSTPPLFVSVIEAVREIIIHNKEQEKGAEKSEDVKVQRAE